MNLDKISFSNITKNTSSHNVANSSYTPTQQLKADTVSFTGKIEKTQAVASDVILDFLRKSAQMLSNGEAGVVKDATTLITAGKIQEAINLINKNAPANGAIETCENGIKIIAKKWDGSPVEHVFENVDGFKNLGLVKKVDDKQKIELFENAFGTVPKTSIGMVGWTNVKPENISGGTTLSKADLTKAYEEAVNEYFSPVDRYFRQGIGIEPTDSALVSSVSYSGIDKALMDYGQKNGLNTLTITPYDYAIYGRNQHSFPIIITDTITQYADVYSKMSDNIVVTGGRDHAFKFDAGGKWLKQNNGIVIPVDVLKDYKGIVVPAMINGKIENAAALAYDTFSDPLPKGLVEQFKSLPSDSLKSDLTHPAQQALASAIWNNLAENGFKF